MTLTERFANDEVTKQKAAAFDQMQVADRDRQLYERGLSDMHAEVVNQAARQREIEEEMMRRQANEQAGLAQTYMPYGR
jgi:hypothetical protein